MLRNLVMAVSLLVLLLLSTSAQAGDGYGAGYGCGGYGYAGYFNPWWGGNPYAASRVPTPPYFALHPPVYYSMPVARPYGYSPFAYPGIVQTPEVVVEPVEPAIIDNPYVEPMSLPAAPPSESKADDKGFETAARMIMNPYVSRSEALAQLELTGFLIP